ncbi:50S ribosomal protein L25 [Brevibacillus sp. SYP-B805]|uniref:50S ribosomal protein L25 n=1 Tax=Brevibacillus sp. SYP-B805 TaxID=1578199 RepID=UPI0013EDAF7A|nr:50S ribosomal protein L25 [Brevibacillus sp. SYP-B805]NGQ96481.1 50S ribosomal protein L25 [Brevibacillus sp. SYP-B805]
METIQAASRTAKSTAALRRDGWIPAVVYGTGIANLPIQVKAREMDAALRHQPTNKPFTLVMNGTEHTVMVYELQRHPVTGALLHADFKRINMNERIHTSVPIVLQGDPELGVATLVRHSVEVTCRAADIPESFIVNVDGLHIGDVVLVKDLDIPDTVTVLPDETEVVVSVMPVKAVSDEAADAAEAAGEPAEEAKKG